MEWIKINKKHINLLMKDHEIGKLIRFQLEIATLERPLSLKEKMAIFKRKECYKRFKSVLKQHGISATYVQKKVMEDVNSVKLNRRRTKERMQKKRDMFDGTEGPCYGVGYGSRYTVREEKRRPCKDKSFHGVREIKQNYKKMDFGKDHIKNLKSIQDLISQSSDISQMKDVIKYLSKLKSEIMGKPHSYEMAIRRNSKGDREECEAHVEYIQKNIKGYLAKKNIRDEVKRQEKEESKILNSENKKKNILEKIKADILPNLPPRVAKHYYAIAVSQNAHLGPNGQSMEGSISRGIIDSIVCELMMGSRDTHLGEELLKEMDDLNVGKKQNSIKFYTQDAKEISIKRSDYVEFKNDVEAFHSQYSEGISMEDTLSILDLYKDCSVSYIDNKKICPDSYETLVEMFYEICKEEILGERQ